MDFPIRFVSQALVDIDKAMSWYESKQVGLSKKFYFSIKITIEYLRENPEAFPIKRKAIREISVKKFPYIVSYKILDSEILILSVFHTSQNPTKKL